MQIELATNKKAIYAAGMRNPVGMAYLPGTDKFYTVVNERDMLGSDLVPDYLTNVPIGAQYGWPWVYWKRQKKTNVRKKCFAELFFCYFFLPISQF